MPSFEFRFDLAAVLLASVLTALGVSAAPANTNSKPDSEEVRDSADGAAALTLAGGKGGVTGGDVRSRGDSRSGR